ncbi:MAG: hypothetical protein HZA01_17030 [Nitrospinae bacterium]|nr:hypothetical protein [Nitrospinota bacterium]
MNQVIFVMDESGAKGYSDNIESTPGELGVMAGYLIPIDCLSLVKSELDAIRSNFFSEGKIHITDLLPQQEELRKNIFDYFLQRKIYWVYEAAYVQGYFENADFLNQLNKKAHDSRRSNIQVSWKETKELLHSELFQGAFGKALAFCLDYVGRPFELRVITDRTDNSIIKKFQSEADALLSVGKEKIHETTGFNKKTKQIVRGSIATKVSADTDAIGDFSGITYSIACEDSSLTLAADVLVNSAHYHLKLLQSESTGVALNVASSISNHQLSSLVYGAWDNTEGNYFADAIFMHPTQKSRDNT